MTLLQSLPIIPELHYVSVWDFVYIASYVPPSPSLPDDLLGDEWLTEARRLVRETQCDLVQHGLVDIDAAVLINVIGGKLVDLHTVMPIKLFKLIRYTMSLLGFKVFIHEGPRDSLREEGRWLGCNDKMGEGEWQGILNWLTRGVEGWRRLHEQTPK